jgi:hypothetical protein
MGRVGFDARKFFALGWPYVQRPLPSKENRQISKRDDLGPPVVQGGQEIGLGSQNLRPRAVARRSGRAGGLSPLVSARRATWPNGEWGCSTRRHMLEPVHPGAVLPDRVLCVPTFSHFLIVNKTSLPPPGNCTSTGLSTDEKAYSPK